MLNVVRIWILLGFLLGHTVWAMAPEKAGLHLSFETRLFFTYGLIAYGEAPESRNLIAGRAQKYFQSVLQMKPERIVVENFAEFMKQYKGDWPNTHSVALDLEVIEGRGPQALKIFVGRSPRVQRQIDAYMKWSSQATLNIVKEHTPSFDKTFALLRAGGASEYAKDLERGEVRSELFLSVSDVLVQRLMGELNRVGEKIAQSGMAQQKDGMMQLFLETMFQEYFARLGVDSKKLIISSFFGQSLNLSDNQKFELMVQNSGPQMQKLLQVVARQADMDPNLTAIFQKLENAVRPVPWFQVQKILDSEISNFNFLYFERKPLGVGTMAQVHRAKLSDGGKRKDVIVRFIKPGIQERIEEDQRILTEVARILDVNPLFENLGAPKLSPVVRDLTQTVLTELNVRDTEARQKIASTSYERDSVLNAQSYKNSIHFHVPVIFEGTGDSKLMVQEMVIGRKLDKEVSTYQELIPEMKRLLVEEIAELWANELVFGKGFYHSDLHQGNFMVRVVDSGIVVNILDYGMGGVISKEMQGQVILLGAGIESLDPNLIARGFWAVSDKTKNTISREKLGQILDEKVQSIRSGIEKRMTLEKWIGLVMNQGLSLPYDFINLNRGMVILNKSLAEAGSRLTMMRILRNLALRHPLRVYEVLSEQEKIPHSELVKLGWRELESRAKFLRGQSKAKTSSAPPRCENLF